MLQLRDIQLFRRVRTDSETMCKQELFLKQSFDLIRHHPTNRSYQDEMFFYFNCRLLLKQNYLQVLVVLVEHLFMVSRKAFSNDFVVIFEMIRFFDAGANTVFTKAE